MINYFFKKNDCSLCITPCAVPVDQFYFERMTQITKAVRDQSRENLPCQPYRTKFFGIESVAAGFEMAFDKRIVEVDIVRYENISLQIREYGFCNLFKGWCICYHFIGDTG